MSSIEEKDRAQRIAKLAEILHCERYVTPSGKVDFVMPDGHGGTLEMTKKLDDLNDFVDNLEQQSYNDGAVARNKK